MALLEIRDLRVHFATHLGPLRAVDGVSLELERGETLALVGESGSGKSVTNLALMGLVPSPPGRVVAERMRFDDLDLMSLPARERRGLRGRRMAMVFQDPMTSLNPFLTVGRQLTEVLETHLRAGRREARRAALAGLDEVGIAAPEECLSRFPHELSGGMRQRVMIAMALLCRPEVLIADEPTTALDVTIQAQILQLLRALQGRHGTAILLVTHDLGVVAGMADRVAVMYAGRLVESAPCDSLFRRPLHPYTRGLLACASSLGGESGAELASIPGHPPDPQSLSAGCAFEPRCASAVPRCAQEDPLLESLPGDAARLCACFERPAAPAEEEDGSARP